MYMGNKHSSFLVFVMKPKNWWLPFAVIFVISIAGVSFIGYETYRKAPPIPNFVDKARNVIISGEQVIKGQQVFHHYALMEYGSMFGDGALRGPDFTAQALEKASEYQTEFYRSRNTSFNDGISEYVKKEMKQNTYDERTNEVTLTPAQVYATKKLSQFYLQMFTNPQFPDAFKPSGYIKDGDELQALTDFFLLGSLGICCFTPWEKLQLHT
jgi:nitric oxide reductase subunit B